MRSRSTIDGILEDVISELEYELENETGAEFDTPPPNFKWNVYTSVDLSGPAWRFDREIIAPRSMDSNDAFKYEQDFLKKLARTTGPLSQRVGTQRCVLNLGTWMYDMGHCKQIEVLTGKISACDGAPPRTC